MHRILPFDSFLQSQIDYDKKKITIFYGIQPISIINLDDKKNIYINAVNLVCVGMKRNHVAGLFGINDSWLCRLMKIYNQYSYEGILRLERGHNTKVTPEIKEYIETRFYYYTSLGIKNYRTKIINDIFEKHGIQISTETLRITLKKIVKNENNNNEIKNIMVTKKKNNETEESESESSKTVKGTKESEVKETKDSEVKETKDGEVKETKDSEVKEIKDSEVKETKDSDEVTETKDSDEVTETKDSDEVTETKDSEVKGKRSNYNRYSGLLLLNVFIREIPIIENFTKQINANLSEFKTIILIIIYMLFLSKTKIENYKELKHSEIEEILDCNSYKYPDDMRKILRDNLCFEELMKVNKSMFSYYIESEKNTDYWIFIDGHVIRYYGKNKIPKTYHQQSNCAVPGRVKYYMHSSEGKPIYFEINDCYNDFREMINKLIAELKNIKGEDEAKEYLYVFDRGSYSYKEFEYLKENNIFYITWNKNDKINYEELDLDFKKIEVERKGNNIDKPETKTIEVALVDENYILKNPNKEGKNKFITLKKIVIKQGRKYSSALANDEKRSIEELAKAITSRWREEKSFEVEAKYRGLNDINSYKVEDFSEEVIKKMGYEDVGVKHVYSNEYKKYLRDRKKIDKEIQQHCKKLGKLLVKIKERSTTENKKHKDITKEIDKLNMKKKELEDKLVNCKKTIRKLDKLIEDGMKRLDYTQKFFMDVIRVACAHIDYNIMKILSGKYKNGRDIYKLIDIITQTGGYIEKDKNGDLIVSLCKLNNKKENDLLEFFINYVNNQNPYLILNKSKKIFFKINNS